MRRLCVIVTCALMASPAEAIETRFPAAATPSIELRIESTTDLAVFSPLVAEFQRQWPDVTVTYDEITTNELNALVSEGCEAKRYVADLVISSSIDQQLKLVNDGCGLPVADLAPGRLPDWAQWRNELFGLTFEPAVIVFNRSYFSSRPAPQNRFDLIDLLREGSAFQGKVATYNIETSGVGYLLAFLDAAQATTWGRLVESLGRNSVQLFCCTSDILDRVADGRVLIGYNVLGSYALARAEDDPRIGVVLPSDYTLVLSRAAFVSRDGQSPEMAKAFLDYLYSPEGTRLLAGPSRLFSPIDGADGLFGLKTDGTPDPQSLRPVPFTPALLVGLDQSKRQVFLEQWRAAVVPTSTAQ